MSIITRPIQRDPCCCKCGAAMKEWNDGMGVAVVSIDTPDPDTGENFETYYLCHVCADAATAAVRKVLARGGSEPSC